MLEFRRIEKSGITALRKYIDFSGKIGCEYNLVSAYLWSREYDLKIAEHRGALIKAYYRSDGSVWGYCVPMGKNRAEAVRAVIAHAESRGEKAAFDYMSLEEKSFLESNFPERFAFSRQYDTCDYIYNRDDLAKLPGKKYHAKRNHVSRFYRSFDDVRLEMIDNNNKEDALSAVRGWCEENGLDPGSYAEYLVIKEALDNLESFDMKGVILYVGGVPVAMTLGCAISDICFDVCFEKALRAYDGSYAVINREFADFLKDYKYLNREEDMGIEGLKKAKLSYHPAIIYDRFRAELRDE